MAINHTEEMMSKKNRHQPVSAVPQPVKLPSEIEINPLPPFPPPPKTAHDYILETDCTIKIGPPPRIVSCRAPVCSDLVQNKAIADYESRGYEHYESIIIPHTGEILLRFRLIRTE